MYTGKNLAILGLSLLSVSSFASKKVDDSKTNVILIITDDQGYGDLGIHKNPQVKTPVIDKLASQSIKFSNFYVSPVCAPTRSSLMTGRYSIRTGVYDTYSGGSIMASNETTLAEVFNSAGYQTGIFGKWHLGDSYPSRPQDQGFTTSVWHLSGGIGQVGDVFNYDKGNRSYFDPILWKNGKQFQSKGYCSDVFTNEAIDFIKQQKDQPFFLYLSYNAPHIPLQVPEEYYNKFKDVDIDPQYFKNRGEYVAEMSERDKEAARKVYAMVNNIDDNIGRLMTTLKTEGLDENTIIIFMTDNGPQQYRYTGGFRGKKSLVREGGIHVPFYIKTPKSLSNVKEINEPAAHIDILPTLAELCNIDYHTNHKLDGISFASSIKGEKKTATNRSLFFEWQRSYPELYRNMAVRKGDYKLIGNCGANANIEDFELYNLKSDPYETTNIIDKEEKTATILKKELEGWYKDIMDSPNINKLQRIIIGSPHENPVILNRNDARGMQLIWDQDDIHVSWDVTIAKEGHYSAKCYFRNPIDKTGSMLFRIGNKNITIPNKAKGIKEITIDDIYLNEGDFTIDGWYLVDWKTHYTPFYIVLEKKLF
ncbi:DUF4976 domain-containing protein [Puteibacter caeruleilacunae]|nr:DUF4976 domain-containing protein [Puteibacter caeruleilacunae]